MIESNLDLAINDLKKEQFVLFALTTSGVPLQYIFESIEQARSFLGKFQNDTQYWKIFRVEKVAGV